jgi:NAD(P)-dependent dehydrogenase (short-subunit alcohol dehydrogenase family)
MADRSAGIALVTGGNRGIGFEVCRQLAERGFTVVLTARDADKARAAAAKIKNAGHVEPAVLDVYNARSIERAAADISSRYDHLDILINNAGINYDTWETAENADIEGTVMETITTNLLGPWRVCQAFLPLLQWARRRASCRFVLGSSVCSHTNRVCCAHLGACVVPPRHAKARVGDPGSRHSLGASP